MTPEKRILQAVEQAQQILASYIEPGKRDCEATINELLSILDNEQLFDTIAGLKRRENSVRELRHSLDRGEAPFLPEPAEISPPDLPPMPEERRPQDPYMDGSGLRFDCYRIETREHAGEYPDTMPQLIEVIDAEGRRASYVPLRKDGKVVDSSTIVQALKDCGKLTDDQSACTEAEQETEMEKPTEEQLAELRRLSKLARVPDESEIVTSREEAETRIHDLEEKARME